MLGFIGWWWAAIAIPVGVALATEGGGVALIRISVETVRRDRRRFAQSRVGRGLSHVSLSAGGEGVLALIGLSVGVFTAGIAVIAIDATNGDVGIGAAGLVVLWACWIIAGLLFLGATIAGIHIASDAEHRRVTLEGLRYLHEAGHRRKQAILSGAPEIQQIAAEWRQGVYEWLVKNDPGHVPIWTTGRPFPMATRYLNVSDEQSNAALGLDVDLQKLVDIMLAWERR